MVQLVECLLAKEKVTGSSPVARSNSASNSSLLAFVENGDVAKWQGTGLQNPYHGFKSHRRLFFFKYPCVSFEPQINKFVGSFCLYLVFWRRATSKSHRRLF